MTRRSMDDQGTNPVLELLGHRLGKWRMFLAGAATAWLIPLVIAWVAGPKSSLMEEDPLTGRLKRTDTWMGLTLSTRIEENEVSRWADGNSIPGTYPAQYGWSQVTVERRGWFTGTEIGCGGHGIPRRIQRGEIAVEGLTPAETLKTYQSELVSKFRQHGSTYGVQNEWYKKAKAR